VKTAASEIRSRVVLSFRITDLISTVHLVATSVRLHIPLDPLSPQICNHLIYYLKEFSRYVGPDILFL